MFEERRSGEEKGREQRRSGEEKVMKLILQ